MKRISILFASGEAVDLAIDDGGTRLLRPYNWQVDEPGVVDEVFRAVPVTTATDCENPDCKATFKLLMQSNRMLADENQELANLRAEVERHKGYLRGCDEYKDLLHGKIEKLTAALREIDQIVKIHPDLLIPRDYNMSEIEIARTQKAILNLGDIARAALAGKEGGGDGN